MRFEAFYWNSGQPLTEDYVHRFPKTDGLYEYNPWDPESLALRANWLDRERHSGADRHRLAEALRRFNERAGHAKEVSESIDLLTNEKTLCVVGGQQASLFTGPLLVIYKAVTLIRAAREASEKLHRPVVPVFWIAGEDHDFDEVNHTFYLSASMEIEKIKVEHPTGLRSSVSRTKIAWEQWEDALNRLDQSLMPTEFKPGMMESLRSMAESSSSLVDLFARVITMLFGSHGLVLMDSDDPSIRALEGPMFAQIVECGGELNRTLLQGRSKLEGLGYKPQVELNERGANLFVYDGDERILLYANEHGGYSDRKGERRFTADQLKEWASTAPERLSNNVMTRPLMQDYLFPVLQTVLGPSEIAYWGLTREAFHLMGMRMPIIMPRLGFTLVEGTIQKNMLKYGMTLEDVLFRLEEKQEAWLKEQDQLHLESRFAEVKASFRESYEPLISTIAGINPSLEKLGQTNLGKILEQIDFLEHKAEDALRSQYDAGLRQFQRIGLSVLPTGKPQERVYNVFAYLNKYGDSWLKELLEQPMELDGKHQVCYF